MAALYPDRGPGYYAWEIDPPARAQVGAKVALIDSTTSAWLTAASRPAQWAFINIGVNDLSSIPPTGQAAFETSLGSIMDKIHAAWPDCVIGVSKVWARGYDTAADTFAGYVDNVIAARAGWVVPPTVSDDERVWLRGADNGATMTIDGTHYSTAGNTEKENQLKSWMGY